MIPARSKTEEFVAQASEFAACLGGKEHLLIATHTPPDGDAIASLLAAREILITLGSNPVCCLEGEVPRRYGFLPGSDTIRSAISGEEMVWDLALVVDSGSLSRIGEVEKRISPEGLLVNIDHHADNGRFGRLNLVYPHAASTTEILFDLVEVLNLPVSENLATLLYTGLLTDTGGFRFSNTSERVFTIAAQLVHFGADPEEISEAVYACNSPASMKLLGEALSSLELTCEGRVAMMTIQQHDRREELEDLADYALAVKGVQVSALFRVKEGASKVSLRGRGAADVAAIARRFGGGGHPKAAGFTQEGNPEEIRAQVIKALTQEVENRTAHPAGAK